MSLLVDAPFQSVKLCQQRPVPIRLPCKLMSALVLIGFHEVIAPIEHIVGVNIKLLSFDCGEIEIDCACCLGIRPASCCGLWRAVGAVGEDDLVRAYAVLQFELWGIISTKAFNL